MNRFLSQKARFYSFICIVLLMLVHGYNLKEAYLTPFSSVNEPLTFTTFIEYFLANGILRFRIPLLFIISGYIFALQDQKPYKQRIKKRFVTLIIPYLIWSAVGLLITYWLQQYPYTANLVERSQIDQLGDYRPYSAIGWKGVIYRWLVMPTSFQLWFIRSLFIYNLLYPFFKWVVLKYPAAWFIVLFLLWYIGFQFILIEAQGILFFTVGIWLNKRSYPLERKPLWYSHYLGWLFFVGIAVIKTFMAFELEPLTTTTYWVLTTMHALCIVSGIIAVWFAGDDVVRWCMNKKWFVWSTSFSFIIFGLHVPLIIYISLYFYDVFAGFRYYRLLTYFTAPVVTFFICVGTGVLLRMLVPRVYRVITGGRGFN